jgi:endoribonuclease LACTB2
MSELVPGVPPPPPPAKPRDAAAVILFRRVQRPIQPGEATLADTTEVFWVKREPKLGFAGGFYAFAGGKVDRADAGVPVDGAAGLDATLRVTAARELLEETGVLIARGRALEQPGIDSMRRALLEGQSSFGELLEQQGLRLCADDFPDAGRWVTPPHLPVRFDARFYLVQAPAEAKAEVWPGELTEGEWITPRAALGRWRQGTALLHPPISHALMSLSAYAGSMARLAAALQNPPMVSDGITRCIEFQMGVRTFPLLTPTLPPAAHTNCYVVGHDDLLIVDPGSSDDSETARLVRFVRELMAEGKTPRAVVLTHHHIDHVGGAARVISEFGLPLWCHARTADRLTLPASRLLEDGQILDVGGMALAVAHTPGHARGHLCLIDQASRAAIVGDMVAGIGTIIIDPPEGDMAEYLRQLRRLKDDLGVRTLYPAHGPPIVDGPAKLDEYLQHRAWRESKLLAALPREGVTLSELVIKAYDDVQSVVLPLAERSTVAILEKLEREGRVRLDGDRYRAM